MNELVLEALRLLLQQRTDFPMQIGNAIVESESSARARDMIARIDAALAVMRQDREPQNPADFVQFRRWNKIDLRTGAIVETSEEEFPGLMKGVSRETGAVPVDGPPHRWKEERHVWSGEYGYWCDGCGVWQPVGRGLPDGPCPGRASTGPGADERAAR